MSLSFAEGTKHPVFLQRQLQLLRYTGGTEDRDLHWAGGDGALHARVNPQAGAGHYFSILLDNAGHTGSLQATGSNIDVQTSPWQVLAPLLLEVAVRRTAGCRAIWQVCPAPSSE